MTTAKLRLPGWVRNNLWNEIYSEQKEGGVQGFGGQYIYACHFDFDVACKTRQILVYYEASWVLGIVASSTRDRKSVV